MRARGATYRLGSVHATWSALRKGRKILRLAHFEGPCNGVRGPGTLEFVRAGMRCEGWGMRAMCGRDVRGYCGTKWVRWG